MSSSNLDGACSDSSSRYANITDSDLILAIQQEDKAAFAELVRRNLDRVWRLARNVLRDDSDADDVTQEVFLSVWRARDKWRPGTAQVSTWIYRISINKCIDFKRRKKTNSVELSEEIVDQKAPNAEATIERRQQGNVLLSAIEQLPDAQRLAISLYYYEELEVSEIARALENTEQGVRSLLKRGRQNLRRQMQMEKDLCHDAGRTEDLSGDLRSGSVPVAC